MDAHLPAPDAARVLEATMKIWPPGRDFHARALEAVRTMVGADVGTFNRVNLETGDRDVAIDPPSWIPRMAALQSVAHDYAYQHPLIDHFIASGEGLRAFRLSEYASVDAWRATDLYREYYQPLGLHWHLLLTIPSGDRFVNVVALNRTSSDFSAHDAHVAEAFVPILALGCGGTSPAVGDLSADTSAGWHLIAADVRRSGQRVVADINPSDPEETLVEGARLPRPPRRYDTGEAIGSATRWQLDDDVWVARLLGGTADREVYAARRSDDRAGLMIGLSRRQREVLTLIAAGCTNAEIAAELGVADGTVRKHVENILAITGAPNRAAAAARWSATAGGA